MSAQTSTMVMFAVAAAVGLGGCKKQPTVDPDAGSTAGPSDSDTDDAVEDADDDDSSDEAVAEPLGKANFDEAVHDHFSEVSDCYVAALEGNPELTGTLELEFTIGSEGQVVSVTVVEGSSLTDAGVVDCVKSATASWQFAAPADGEMTLTYPFNLAPG